MTVVRQYEKLSQRIRYLNWTISGSRKREYAKMKTSAIRLRADRGPTAPWNDNWDRLFENVPGSRERRREQQAAYNDWADALSAE